MTGQNNKITLLIIRYINHLKSIYQWWISLFWGKYELKEHVCYLLQINYILMLIGSEKWTLHFLIPKDLDLDLK